ncbi:MAG: penicillin-binding protein activator [Pseudomonadota bacterium]
MTSTTLEGKFGRALSALTTQTRAGLIGLCVLAAAGCETGSSGGGPVIADRQAPISEAPQAPPSGDPRFDDAIEGERRRYDRRGFIEPLHMDRDKPVRVALLLPFTAEAKGVQSVASAMFDAAQMAAFEAGDDTFLLIPKDTRGTPEGAASAARSALADGAEIILGPLFSESVEAVKPVAQAVGAPVIAFSSDVKAGGDGVFLLSFPPEIEIARVTDYAVLNGLSRFGLLAPANDYGERISSSFAEEIYVRGGTLVHEERYIQEPDKMLAPAKRLARYSREVIPLEMRHDFDPANPGPEGSDQGAVQGYQAVMMPEQGTLLRALAPLLPYYNVDINRIKILGVSAWNNPRLTREPALRGGWFAAPDPAITDAFKTRYKAAFGAEPPRLASLSYDATLLASNLAKSPERNRFSVRAITNSNGYFGADGLFRLRPDGSVERGLAILEIQPGGIQVIDPAPRSFAVSF